MNDKPMTVDALMENTRLAWYLGQRYWQQADSESYADNKRSALTLEKFNKLLESSRAAIEQYGREREAAGRGSGEPVAWTGTVVNNVRGKPVDPAACVEWAKNYWWSDDGPVMTIVLLAWREAVMRCDRAPLTDEQIADVCEKAWDDAEAETALHGSDSEVGDWSPETEWSRYGEKVARAIDNIRSAG